MNPELWVFVPEMEPEIPPAMKFRLYYDGPLQPSRPVDKNKPNEMVPRGEHKHAIRKQFHKQLKQLWSTHPVLTNLKVCEKCGPFHHAPSQPQFGGILGVHNYVHFSEYPGSKFTQFGFTFLPIVTKSLDVYASLDVLLLRRDGPGSILDAGDVDNRIKTLIDALKMPGNANELMGISPQNGEEPLYCLLQDDSLVSGFTVETDSLLREARLHDSNKFSVKAIVTVEIKPYNTTFVNLAFS